MSFDLRVVEIPVSRRRKPTVNCALLGTGGWKGCPEAASQSANVAVDITVLRSQGELGFYFDVEPGQHQLLVLDINLEKTRLAK